GWLASIAMGAVSPRLAGPAQHGLGRRRKPLDRGLSHATTRATPSDAPDSLIPYDEIVQEALRAVVGRVLGEVESTGHLPGEHHFYITFKTGAAGVDIPRHLTERFPDEMTIVIQNRFWDLKVGGDGFEVGLSFNQAPVQLVIRSGGGDLDAEPSSA